MAVVTIKVPKTPPSAFNTNRPASDLLKAQLEHLEAAGGAYSAAAATRKRKRALSEGQVAARIHELTRGLHTPTAGALSAAAAVADPNDDSMVGDQRLAPARRAAMKKVKTSPSRTRARRPHKKG